MKRVILILLSVLMWSGLQAQNTTILITQSGLPYESQTWFYSGYGNSLQRDKIKKNWDEGRRITSVAYTSNGWFVTMAKNSGYSEQVYYNNYAWPGDWIKKHWAEGYYITDISVGNKEWMVVMSKGTGYVDQLWRSGKWSVVKEKIKEKWNEDFYITKATCNDGEWMIIMSKGCGMSDQSWSRRASYADIKSVIKEYWDKDYTLTLLSRGEDEIYLAVMSKFEDGSEPGQNYVSNPSNVTDYINKRWDEGHDIVYIGGGGAANDKQNNSSLATNTTTSPKTTNNQSNTVTMAYMGGTMTSTTNPDGSGVVVTDIPCIHCNNGRCKMCFGSGVFVHPYLGTSMPCTMCNMGACRYCSGKGRLVTQKYFAPGEAQAYLQANREVNSGYGGSGSGTGSGSGSGSGSNNIERGIEVIEWQVDYTGEGYADVWCEKCGKWAQPHKHIKKVY